MGVRESQVFPLLGQTKYVGSVTHPLFPSMGIDFLVGALGADVKTGTGVPYTHTISPTNTLPSYTLEKNIGNYESLQFAGCRVNKWGLKTQATDSEAEVTVDWIAKTAAVFTSPTAVTVVNESPFVFAEGVVSLFGGAIGTATNIDINVENVLKDTYTIAASHDLTFLTPTERHVSGTLDVVFESLDDTTVGYEKKLMAGTQGALSLTLTHPTNSYSVQLYLDSVQFSKYADDIKLGDVVISSLSFEANYSLTTSETIKAIVMNGISTGY